MVDGYKIHEEGGTMKRVFAIALMCCAFVLALGLVACGGSSSGSAAASGSASAASASTSGASAGSSAASGDAASEGYLDEHNVITAKALVELDGAELTKLAESASYKWDDKHAEWTRVGADVAPSKGLTSEEMSASNGIEAFEFTADEIAGLAVGGKGTPMSWLVSCKAKYADSAAVLAAQQVDIVDQCEVNHKNYGKEIWAIIKNSAGDRFLLCARHYDSDDSGAVDLFNSEYLATNARGIASCFNSGDYLLEDAHTIDAAWEVLKSGQVS